MNPYEISRERSTRRTLRKMGMYLRKQHSKDGNPSYCIVDTAERPVYGKGYTLALSDAQAFTRDEYRTFTEA